MNNKLCAIAALIAVSALAAGSAGAATVAGWDFSQYRGDGRLTPFTDTLPANYSELDPSFNAGSGAAAFGTLYFNGSFGSSSTVTDFLPTAGTMNCTRVPNGGILGAEGCAVPNLNGPVRSNRNDPWGPGKVSFDAHPVLKAEGQSFQNYLGMTATNTVSVVFEADLGAGNPGTNWGVSFGGKTLSGGGDDGGQLSCDPVGGTECATSVSVAFSPNGSSYTSFGSVNLTADDARFSVPLAATSTETGYVRLGFNPTTARPIIDNVAITATLPEPGTTLMLAVGVLALWALPRRRS